uniref:Cytochrome P450 n=1 Tax=Pseudo-nitzschia australis TaxID=44445 RepID=A0A7S4AHL9_9STRA|mmetsp:Transcript_13945/g.29393  ORF Transcript_13945/g.29393 Transcript_13945/m.29393 type:complete len:643 (-) Transcript_13945:473-2401(-)
MTRSPKIRRNIAVGVVLLFAGFLRGTMAFQLEQPQLQRRHASGLNTAAHIPLVDHTIRSSRSSSVLRAFPAAAATTSAVLSGIGRFLLPPSASTVSRTLRVAALVVAGLLATSSRIRERIFWPGFTYPSDSNSELLPGSLGCPFIGSPMITGNKPSYGAGSFYRTTAHKIAATLGKIPSVWRYYFLGKNFAVLSGGKTFQNVLSMEFGESLGTSGPDLFAGGLMPIKSLLLEREKKHHSYLRRLVGAALTPIAVTKSAPTLQSAAEEQVSKMMADMAANGEVKFLQICTDYTLDVAWRQILGLELPDEEIPFFEEQVATWIKGLLSLRVLFRVGVESTPGYRAREYIISKIEQRIDQLLEQGPDHKSTLSGMIFAVDDENENNEGTGKKLSRQEVIDNALILIFAGSETSASTLTNAMLFLGLHPSVWSKLVQEQERIRAQDGNALTMSSLDSNNAPYLDAFLKETLRMRTIIGGIPRLALKDIDVDGNGKTIIPKGYLVDPSMMLTHEEDPATKLPNAMHLDPIQGFRPERWLDSSDDESTSELRTTYEKPSSDWYVPYGFGPRYCLGKNLAQLEMKIFLATMARKIDFPKLNMLPENYDYARDKKNPEDPTYFSVEWSTRMGVIPNAEDGVLATVTTSDE